MQLTEGEAPVSSGELNCVQFALALDALQLQRAALPVIAWALPTLLVRLQGAPQYLRFRVPKQLSSMLDGQGNWG